MSCETGTTCIHCETNFKIDMGDPRAWFCPCCFMQYKIITRWQVIPGIVKVGRFAIEFDELIYRN